MRSCHSGKRHLTRGSMARKTDSDQSRVLRPESKVQRNPNVVARELGDGEGGVLLHLQSGAYHGVNQVGLLIWELVDGERSIADVVEAVRVGVEKSPPNLDRD